MKIRFSLPSNEAFFSRYATLTPTLIKLGILAQIISGLTEIGIFYTIIYSKVVDFNPSFACVGATIGAILGTLFLELGLRKFTPYSIRAFISKRFKGLDLVMTVLILIINVVLLFASGLLSFNGSKELVEIVKTEPKIASTDKITSRLDLELGSIISNYKSDSAAISKRYKNQLGAKEVEYLMLIEQERNLYYQLKLKEQNDEVSYRSKKSTIRNRIKKLEVEKAKTLARLETEKAQKLELLLERKHKDITELKGKSRTEIAKIESSNEIVVSRSRSKTHAYGLGLGWFTIICLFIFILSVAVDEIHKKGSGIEIISLPSQYDLSPSIWSELLEAINYRISFIIRSKIAVFASKTPPPPIPQPPPMLYNLSHKQPIITFTYGNMPRDQEIELNTPYQNQINSLKHFKNKDNDLSSTKNGEQERINDNRMTKNSIADKFRKCENCKSDYIYNHKKQKYCSDKCRIKAWEERTGKELKMKPKKV